MYLCILVSIGMLHSQSLSCTINRIHRRVSQNRKSATATTGRKEKNACYAILTSLTKSRVSLNTKQTGINSTCIHHDIRQIWKPFGNTPFPSKTIARSARTEKKPTTNKQKNIKKSNSENISCNNCYNCNANDLSRCCHVNCPIRPWNGVAM